MARHRSAKKDSQNLFTWAIDDLQVGDLDHWGFLVSSAADQARVQNPDSMREHDILESTNMGKRERLELLGIQFYECFVEHLLQAPLKMEGFTSQRKRKSTMKKEEGEEAEDDSDDDNDNGGDEKMEPTEKDEAKFSTPAAKKQKLDEDTSVASPVSTAPSKHHPIIFVMLGGGNGNSAVGFLNKAMLSKRAHLLVVDRSDRLANNIKGKGLVRIYAPHS